jgi:hypothetical protein
MPIGSVGTGRIFQNQIGKIVIFQHWHKLSFNQPNSVDKLQKLALAMLTDIISFHLVLMFTPCQSSFFTLILFPVSDL